jgi:hypothetical protein
MAHFSSVLTFETPVGRTAIPPPKTHILATTTYPAPSNFLPLHYARIFLNSSEGGSQTGGKKVVIWLGCDGSGENNLRNALRKNGVNVSKQSFIYIDALEEVLEQQEAINSRQDAALDRLYTRVEEQLSAATRYAAEDGDQDGSEDERSSASCLVIVDDASALAWSITALADDQEGQQGGSSSMHKVDHRVQLLRSKRKGAIQTDSVGKGLANWLGESLRKCCETVSGMCGCGCDLSCSILTYFFLHLKNSAILLTHLTAENTTIVPPIAHTQPTRGGSYGVGTGFDADDAGEEREDEELYEDFTEMPAEDTTSNEGKGNNKGTEMETATTNASLDWRVDSLIRSLLLSADLWIEVRGLRSGKARDCHGEVRNKSHSEVVWTCADMLITLPRYACIPFSDLAWLNSCLFPSYHCLWIHCDLCAPRTVLLDLWPI